MIHDNPPNRIFKISELTRLIASDLVLISQQSAVNLACACRCLEEPILSTLWETQGSLWTLLGVLPEWTWDYERPEPFKHAFRIVGDPSSEAWNRVRRYASWMHQVRVDEWLALGDGAFDKFRLNSPPGGWFPALQDLTWCITSSNLPYADLFLSPHLKRISITMSWSWKNDGVPPDILPILASTISALPTASLQRLSVWIGRRPIPWAHFEDSFSSGVLRCGPLLMEYNSPVPLSDAAMNHLIHLPHLHTLQIYGPPPNYSASSLPLVFPPLKELTLEEGAVRGWLSLLERLDGADYTTQGITPLSRVKRSLKILNIEHLPGLNINPSFVSPIQRFRNLVDLNVEVYCPTSIDEDQCAFKLNNDDVTELTKVLTRLEYLLLGHACSENTCATTIACLLPISIHCIKLHKLEIHFNTTNIVDDLRSISEDPVFQELRSLPRCSLTSLDVYEMSLTLDESGFETVVNGMIDIFPCLARCEGFEGSWDKVSERIAGIRRD